MQEKVFDMCFLRRLFMKKVYVFMLVTAMLMFSFVGCEQVKDGDKSADKLSVVSTVFASYDFTKEIAGNKAEVTMLIPPGSESHSYEPSPKDIIKIQDSDIFIYIGGESDSWVNEILESMDTDNMNIIKLMDCVKVVEEEIVDGMEHEEEEESELDEHVWTSPKNAISIVEKIEDILCEIDKSNENIYKENAEEYIEELNSLDEKFREVVDNSVRKTLIFGDRFPFRYLTDEFGLEYFAAFPGCSTETEAGASTVAFLIDKVKEENIPVVFHVELSNMKMANTIAESTGAEVLLLHACHNVTKDELESGVRYIDFMNQNVENLKEALK